MPVSPGQSSSVGKERLNNLQQELSKQDSLALGRQLNQQQKVFNGMKTASTAMFSKAQLVQYLQLSNARTQQMVKDSLPPESFAKLLDQMKNLRPDQIIKVDAQLAQQLAKSLVKTPEGAKAMREAQQAERAAGAATEHAKSNTTKSEQNGMAKGETDAALWTRFLKEGSKKPPVPKQLQPQHAKAKPKATANPTAKQGAEKSGLKQKADQPALAKKATKAEKPTAQKMAKTGNAAAPTPKGSPKGKATAQRTAGLIASHGEPGKEASFLKKTDAARKYCSAEVQSRPVVIPQAPPMQGTYSTRELALSALKKFAQAVGGGGNGNVSESDSLATEFAIGRRKDVGGQRA